MSEHTNTPDPALESELRAYYRQHYGAAPSAPTLAGRLGPQRAPGPVLRWLGGRTLRRGIETLPTVGRTSDGNRALPQSGTGGRRRLPLFAAVAALLILFMASFLGFSGRLGPGVSDPGQGADPTIAARLPDVNCGDAAAEAMKRANPDAAKIPDATRQAMAGAFPAAEATKRANPDAAKIVEATKIALAGATPGAGSAVPGAEATKRAEADAAKIAEATRRALAPANGSPSAAGTPLPAGAEGDGVQGTVTAVNGNAFTVQSCGQTRTVLADARTNFTVGLDNARKGIVNGSLADVRVGRMLLAKGIREPNGDLRALAVLIDP